MNEDRAELLAHYRQMRSELLTAIDGLTDEQMTEPSLDGWSVNDHLAHVALWDEIRAGEVVRISSGHDSAWRMTNDHADVYNELGYTLRRALSVEQVRWEIATAHEHLLAAIASATAHGLDASRYGEAGLRSTHEAEHAGWIRRWRGEQGT